MVFRIPVKDQLFLLEVVVDIAALPSRPGSADVSVDMVEAIVAGAAEFAEREYAPLAQIGDRVGARWQNGVVSLPDGYRSAYRAFVAQGWGTLCAPQAFGGQGLPGTLATVVMEDIGCANMGFSLINMLTPGAVEALIVHGTPEQQARWLPKLVTGEWNGTMNLTEPQAGSDVGAIRAVATPDGDGGWRIRGQKIFITFGDHDLTDNIVHLVLARTPGAPAGTKGVSLFLVPKLRLDADGAPGSPNDVKCTSIEHKLGIHASPTCAMAFGDDDRCLGELIGAEGEGVKAMFTMMNNARLSVGSQGVQVAERATQQAIGYALERRQSPRANGSTGRTPALIADHPDVRRMLMRMKAQTQAARALIYYAAGQQDRAHLGEAGARATLGVLIPLAKAHAADIGCEVAALGLQVHGGVGYIEETGAARHLRDALIAPIYEGTNGIQAADLVGRKLAGDDGAALGKLVAAVRHDAEDKITLQELAGKVEELCLWMLRGSVDDRLSGSYPFLTMVSVMVCGWLMARQGKVADGKLAAGIGDAEFLKTKSALCDFYLDFIVPEACGLDAAARAGTARIYAIDNRHLAA